MPAGTDPILGPTVVGLLNADGSISDEHRKAFTNEVIGLLKAGNADGKGLTISKLLGVPIPPVAGPSFPSPVDLSPLFWFTPDPYADLSTPFIQDPEGDFQKIFIDKIYAPMLSAININGFYTPAFFDPTIFVPDFDLPDFPDLPALFLKFPTLLLPPSGQLFVKLPKPFPPPPPELPSLPALPPPLPVPPTLASLGLPEIPNFALPGIFAGIIKTLFGVIPTLPTIFLPIEIPTPAALFEKLFKPLFDPMLDFMVSQDLVIITPKLFVAALIVMLKNFAAALAVDAVGLILGAGGICKIAAKALGL
jgi:hypothetical protein